MTKLCIVEHRVEHCNHTCPNFYHKFEDFENCYCAKLDKKVYDYGYNPDEYEDPVMFDYVKRPIPADCPLPDV
jgi:hypothetical protein